MSNQVQFNNAETLLANVRADVNELMGGKGVHQTADGNGGNGSDPAGGPLKSVLKDLKDILQKLIDALGGEGNNGGSTGGTGGTGGSGSAGGSEGGEVIAGKGRIWGDPHFIGADGGKYDVQGEAGKTYNLLSDKDFQMNGRFDSWGSKGATVVGQVGIAAGNDQVEVHKDGKVMVNGQELKDGERVELDNGGFVEKNGKDVKLESGEWKVDFQTRGDHINMDVSTDNAVADGVKPHGLLGQTFDGDGKARNGDKGTGAQGGGAIEGENGIVGRGNRNAVEMYEVDNIHDRNFTEFNQFFDDAESNPGQYDNELNQMIADAFSMMAQSMVAMMNFVTGQKSA